MKLSPLIFVALILGTAQAQGSTPATLPDTLPQMTHADSPVNSYDRDAEYKHVRCHIFRSYNYTDPQAATSSLNNWLASGGWKIKESNSEVWTAMNSQQQFVYGAWTAGETAQQPGRLDMCIGEFYSDAQRQARDEQASKDLDAMNRAQVTQQPETRHVRLPLWPLLLLVGPIVRGLTRSITGRAD